MLVFRNQTSYNRFWDGRNGMASVQTSVRNLVRTITTNSYSAATGTDASGAARRVLTATEKEDIERTVRILMAIPYAVKNHLRAEWGAAFVGTSLHDVVDDGSAVFNSDYAGLLPVGLQGHEDEGLSLPFQLTFFVDSFIKRGVDRGWFHAPGASQMQAQLNSMMDVYGKMETIKLTPIPVAHLSVAPVFFSPLQMNIYTYICVCAR